VTLRRLIGLLACSSALLTTLVACGDDDTDVADPSSSTTSTTSTTVVQSTDDPVDVTSIEDFGDLAPGTYFIDADGDPSTSLRAVFDVAGQGWSSWVGAVKFSANGHVAVTITEVTNVVRHACTDHDPADPPVGPTVDDLVAALSTLAPFELAEPPSPVTIDGYRGQRFRLTVPELRIVGTGDHAKYADCTSGNLSTYISEPLGGDFYGYNAEPGRTEEIRIIDVDGTRLLLATQWSPAESEEDIGEMQAVFDSIRIER
jgi:hypothetical protein